MSHPHGAYLGGIRTVSDIRDRCRVDGDTGCWHWGLAIVNGLPKVHFVTPDGRRVSMRGRRAALFLKRGRDIPRGHVAFAIDTCESADCVNPYHCVSGDRFTHGEYLRRTGKSAASPAKAAAAVRSARRRARLTMDLARAIRAAEGSHVEIAQRFGIAASQVGAIRANKAWRETFHASSIFTMGAQP